MLPKIPITDPAFKYDAAIDTDIRKRFDKIRSAQQAAAAPKQSEYVTTIINLFEQRRREER